MAPLYYFVNPTTLYVHKEKYFNDVFFVHMCCRKHIEIFMKNISSIREIMHEQFIRYEEKMTDNLRNAYIEIFGYAIAEIMFKTDNIPVKVALHLLRDTDPKGTCILIKGINIYSNNCIEEDQININSDCILCVKKNIPIFPQQLNFNQGYISKHDHSKNIQMHYIICVDCLKDMNPEKYREMRQCRSCLKSEYKILLCSKCKCMRYCSKECQKKDWKRHKSECREVNDDCYVSFNLVKFEDLNKPIEV